MVTLASSLPLRLGELSLKNDQSPTDEYSEIAQRWKDKTASEGHSLAENYANARIAFICDVHAAFLCRNHEASSASDSPLGDRELFASLVYVADVADKLELQMGNDEPMFVLNVETVKLPDGVTIPSLVGLYGLDDVIDQPFGGLTFQSARDGSFKVIPCLVRRKGYVLRSLTSDGEFNIAHGAVESASKIVDGIARDAHQPSRHRWTRYEFERIASSIRLTALSDSVSVIAGELTDAKLEIFEMLSGPFDL